MLIDRRTLSIPASGGLLEGPGSGTSDDIPIMASNGEFVVNAKSTAKNLSLLEAINSGTVGHYAAGGQVAGFAAGGHVKAPKLSVSAKAAAAALKSSISSVAHWIPQAIATAVEASRASAVKEIQILGMQVSGAHNAFVTNLVKTSGQTLIKLGSSYDAIKVKLKDAQTNLAQLKSDSAKLAADTASKIVDSGSILGVDPTSAMTSDQEAALKAAQARQKSADAAATAAEKSASDAQTRASRAQERYDISNKTASDSLTLKNAQQDAANAQDAADRARNLADQASANVDAANSAAGTDPAKAMIDHLHQSITTATQFGQALTSLKQKGLDATSLSQIAAAGPEAGLATANALLQGGKTAIDQVAALQKQLAATATSSGQQVADSMYASGISAAQGLVKGLASQESNLLAQVTKMVNSMMTSIKKQLKIKSPSKVTEDEIGNPMGAGVPIGFTKAITAGMPDIHAALGGMTGSVGSFSVGGIPKVGVTPPVASGAMQATIPIVINIDGKQVFASMQTASLRHNARNTSNGLGIPRGR